jgi:hypothetical protein
LLLFYAKHPSGRSSIGFDITSSATVAAMLQSVQWYDFVPFAGSWYAGIDAIRALPLARLSGGRKSMIRAVNIRWGLGWGLAFAAFYCVIALVLNALSDGEAFPEKRVTLPQVLVLYVTCGVLAGLVVGALRPLTKTKMGATVVGTIVAFPVSMGFGLLHFGGTMAMA